MSKKQWTEWAWDAWCIASIIGIWPRYIEPRLLEVNRLSLPIAHLPAQLVGLNILHFSDLHWSAQFSFSLRKKLIRKINALKPDLILFTGDFLCRSQLEDREGLKNVLESLKATIGCFAVLGNHDYARFVTVNEQGDYDVEAPSSASNISKGFKRLFRQVSLTQQVTPQARQVDLHAELMALLKQTPFQILNNATKQIAYKGQRVNICGLGEYSLGRFNPEIAFKEYDERYPGIILSHNPDALEILKHYPGEIILSGHTHGGQVNLPIFWKRFTRIAHLQFKHGLKVIDKKWAYINRGISSVMKFRWFAAPELTLLTLQKG
ncbi:MAG: UDP-2,3-diacylglucosamine diphosphatase LpxG [Proteobacteria bacterium]|nr:UDP-2,3-diacylglucosamine diphosphatase LpxG [Pseudomonadota bacterium]